MHIVGVHHVAIQVVDVARVAQFYREVLGLNEKARHFREDGVLRSIWIETTPEGSFLAIEDVSRFRPSRGELGASMVALRVDPADRRGWIERLKKFGVEVFKETRWTLYVKDPEGNVVGLSHHPFEPA